MLIIIYPAFPKAISLQRIAMWDSIPWAVASGIQAWVTTYSALLSYTYLDYATVRHCSKSPCFKISNYVFSIVFERKLLTTYKLTEKREKSWLSFTIFYGCLFHLGWLLFTTFWHVARDRSLKLAGSFLCIAPTLTVR